MTNSANLGGIIPIWEATFVRAGCENRRVRWAREEKLVRARFSINFRRGFRRFFDVRGANSRARQNCERDSTRTPPNFSYWALISCANPLWQSDLAETIHTTYRYPTFKIPKLQSTNVTVVHHDLFINFRCKKDLIFWSVQIRLVLT